MNILITGASSGFGRDIAKLYAHRQNYINLYLLARRQEQLESLKHEIDKLDKNIEVYIHSLDLRDFSKVRELCNPLEIDLLINNAGLALGKEPAYNSSFSDWENVIDVNIKSLSLITNILLPGMVKRGCGHIVNIGSIAGSYPYPGSHVYGASKAYVRQFSNNLRSDLYDKNIRVSTIEPGLCEGSDFSITRFRGDRDRATSLYSETKPLHSKDIAEIVYWVTTLPPHVNINAIEVMPTVQAWSDLNVHKLEK